MQSSGVVTFLKIFLFLVWLWMIYVVVSTSLESSLFAEWDYLGSIPWMRATLWDFYANILVIYLFVLYRERSWAIKALWLALFFCLGSIGSIGYVLIELSRLKNGEGLNKILQPK
ncbi:MAG: DUF1475 family protein [Bacteroidota bacterium]